MRARCEGVRLPAPRLRVRPAAPLQAFQEIAEPFRVGRDFGEHASPLIDLYGVALQVVGDDAAPFGLLAPARSRSTSA